MKKQSKETIKEKNNMNKHMENIQSSSLKCSNCDEVFEKKSRLDSHMLKQHKNKQVKKWQVRICKHK